MATQLKFNLLLRGRYPRGAAPGPSSLADTSQEFSILRTV